MKVRIIDILTIFRQLWTFSIYRVMLFWQMYMYFENVFLILVVKGERSAEFSQWVQKLGYNRPRLGHIIIYGRMFFFTHSVYT